MIASAAAISIRCSGRILALVLMILPVSAAAAAEAPRLSMPIACEPGRDCFVQQYPDWDPGPGATDYRCGPQTYDTHTGTDIRLPDIRALDRNVSVVAAAAGTVKAVRDGLPDAFLNEVRPELLENQGCGNAVILSHAGGLDTWYCHLKRGSIAVQEGQKVERGEPIAAVGLSGNTEFVHLEFVARRGGQALDPFTGTRMGPASGKTCGAHSGPGLWTDEAANALAYRPAAIVNAGFSGAKVSSRSIEIASHTRPLLPGSPLFLYVRVMHAAPGDGLLLSVDSAAGSLLKRRARIVIDRPKAQWSAAIPITKPAGGWPDGPYRAEIQLLRAGKDIARTAFEVVPFTP